MEKIDLHMHSILSDGENSVASLILESKKNNCKLISITDHDVINDFSNLSDADIQIINGIEFNSSEKNLHLLGYNINNIDTVSKITEELLEENEFICLNVIKLLQSNKYDISADQIKEYFLNLGIDYQYLDKKKIAKYLTYKNYASDIYSTYLNIIGKGTKNYIPIKKLPPKYIINLILESGGIPVLAHPASLNMSDSKLLLKIEELMSYGLEGIETYNFKFSTELEQKYHNYAKELNLLETAGSDFHSNKKQAIGIEVPDEIIDKFKIRVRK